MNTDNIVLRSSIDENHAVFWNGSIYKMGVYDLSNHNVIIPAECDKVVSRVCDILEFHDTENSVTYIYSITCGDAIKLNGNYQTRGEELSLFNNVIVVYEVVTSNTVRHVAILDKSNCKLITVLSGVQGISVDTDRNLKILSNNESTLFNMCIDTKSLRVKINYI